MLGASVQMATSVLNSVLALNVPYTFGHISLTLLMIGVPFTSAAGWKIERASEYILVFLISSGLAALPEIVVIAERYPIHVNVRFPIIFYVLAVWAIWFALIKGRSDSILDQPEFDIWEVGTFISTIVAFRAVSEWTYALGIPNLERSTIIFGYEIHHFVLGFVGMIFVWPLLRKTENKPILHRVVRISCAVSLGMLWDQATFLWVPGNTDEAYFQWHSWIGAIVGCIFFSGSALVAAKRKKGWSMASS